VGALIFGFLADLARWAMEQAPRKWRGTLSGSCRTATPSRNSDRSADQHSREKRGKSFYSCDLLIEKE